MSRTSQTQSALIVGREREQALLSGLLADALAGRGALALVGGMAGIGKSTLARACAAEAGERGFRVLTGMCYDAGPGSPYGPWLDLADSRAPHDEAPLPWNRGALVQAPGAETFVAQLRDALLALAARGPLLVVLEDLHWADPESLEFLRGFARALSPVPLLLVATYRDDDLTPNAALYQLVPHLVREADAQRITLTPLDADAIQVLVRRRYALAESDLVRLATHLSGRGQGVPLYLVELLRALEEERRLRHTADGWMLGDLEHGQVPTLVRQVIDGRLARLGAEVRRLLELAAVIGQEAPLLLWRQVGGTSADVFDDAVERALDSHLLEEAPSGLRVRFTHALVRDALYAGMSLPQRQRRHRRVAEALALDAGAEPDAVAHHFRQALDPRAAEWFVRAGSRVEQVAWLTAAGYFALALDMPGGAYDDPTERGWLLLRRAKLLRGAEPRTSLTILDAAEALARESRDALLRAYVLVYRGEIRCAVGEVRTGISDLEASLTELARLTPVDLQRLDELERLRAVLSRSDVDGLLASTLAFVGRIDEAVDRAGAIIERADGTPMIAWWARAIALALAGKASEASEAFAMCCDEMLRVSADTAVAILMMHQLSLAQVPYGADDLPERRRIAAEGEAAWRRSRGAHDDVPPHIAWLPLLLLEGDWRAAGALALSGVQAADATSEKHLASAIALAQMSRAQGDASLAWAQVHSVLPGGPQTIPGDIDLAPSLTLMRVAVMLCLDRGDLAAARGWLEAHDRWLDWSGAVLGQADGRNAWASYALAAGDPQQARLHAEQAFALASAPRQPLALLAAQRLAGVVEAHAGRTVEARQHLEASLALADACAAPYERALTLLASADLSLRSGAVAEAGSALDEARSICTHLAAGPTLAQIDALEARLGDHSTVMERTAPVGLSPREIDVLRLLANGRSNREIAENLCLSARTVERHVTHLYNKIGVASRAEAIAFAHEQDLI